MNPFLFGLSRWLLPPSPRDTATPWLHYWYRHAKDNRPTKRKRQRERGRSRR